jgi:hypothetical protein
MVQANSRHKNRAERISYNINQQDSALLFERGIAITKNDKFRNQSVYVTVYVPVGKRIIVNNGIGWGNDFHIELGGDVDDWYWRNDEEGYNWSDNVEYIMTNDGLKPTHSTDEDNDNNDEEENDLKPALPAEPAAPGPGRFIKISLPAICRAEGHTYQQQH